MITEQEHQFTRSIMEHFSDWYSINISRNNYYGGNRRSITIYAHHGDKFAVHINTSVCDIIADPELAAQKAINYIHVETAKRNSNNG